MIIPSRKLIAYFEKLIFPVVVLEERSDAPAATVTQVELLALIAKEQVIGIGSWNRIKRFRLNTPFEKSVIASPELYGSTCTAFARTRQGVFRQPLFEPITEQFIFQDAAPTVGLSGNPGRYLTQTMVIGETTNRIGYAYAFYGEKA